MSKSPTDEEERKKREALARKNALGEEFEAVDPYAIGSNAEKEWLEKAAPAFEDGKKFLAYVKKLADQQLQHRIGARGKVKYQCLLKVLKALEITPQNRESWYDYGYTRANIASAKIHTEYLSLSGTQKTLLGELGQREAISLNDVLDFHRHAFRETDKASWLPKSARKVLGVTLPDTMKANAIAFLEVAVKRLKRPVVRNADNKIREMERLITELKSIHIDSENPESFARISTVENLCGLRAPGSQYNLLQVLMMHRKNTEYAGGNTITFKKFSQRFDLNDILGQKKIREILNDPAPNDSKKENSPC